jgi:chemotaxis protein MotB
MDWSLLAAAGGILLLLGLGYWQGARLAAANRRAAEALRARLQQADIELTAMTMALEAQRRRAEETLTLLAAAQQARDQAQSQADTQITEAQTRAANVQAAMSDATGG